MNIYDLEKLSKKEPSEVYKRFVEMLDQKKYTQAISYFKKSGIFLSKNSNLLKAIDTKIFTTIGRIKEFNEFIEQYKIIKQLNLTHSDNEKEFMNDLNNKLEEIKQPITLLYSAASLITENTYDISNEQKYSDYNEGIVAYVSLILKIYLHKKNEFIYSELIDKSDVKNMSEMIGFAAVESYIKTMNDIWRFSEIKVREEKNKITLYEMGDFGKSLRISQTNFLDIIDAKYKKLHFEYRFNRDNYNYDRIYFEIMKNFIKEYFYTDDLNQEYDGVTLNDWIKAYIKIVDYGNNKLKHKVIIKDKTEWQSLFIESGIKEESINKIISKLIFTTKSRDLFDCPFIEFDRGIAFIPAIASIINPSRSLLSLLSNNSSKNTKINQKGSNFESSLKNTLSKCNINSINMKLRDYELDIVFKIDNDLFIIEAKTMNQPTNYWEFMRYQDEIDNYIGKFRRNYSFFCEEENIISIKKKLGMESIDNIYKIFVTNILDTRSKINEIYMTNDTVFEGYFLRAEPMGHIWKGNTMISKPLFTTDAYKGKYTGTQFIKLIEDNLFAAKNTKRVIHESIILPYYFPINDSENVGFDIKRYGLKNVDLSDLFTE